MAIVYPAGLDTFSVPSLPASTSLSSAGTSTRDHTQNHQDLGLAVMALESNSAQLGHDHSGTLASISVSQSTLGAQKVNDTQTVAISGSPTGGTFTLSVAGYGTTVAIAYNASTATVQTDLQAVVGSSNVLVGGSVGAYVCVFQGGLANTPMPTMTAVNSLTGGTSPQVGISHNVVGSAGGNEVQIVSLNGGPTGGTFQLLFGGYTTTALPYNAPASGVAAALAALTSIGGSGNIAVTGSAGGPYTVTFQGTLANAPQAILTYISSLTGGLFATQQLQMANTHLNPDTDTTVVAMHHTIGAGATQAAAGNHSHDYNGPSIYNQPYIVCTSTTRPTNPFQGLTIFETDTYCWRVWGAFNSNNTLNTGIDYQYLFNTNNSQVALDSAIFSQTYPTGSSPADGAMGAPAAGVCEWNRGANVNCRCIAQAVVANNNTFVSDNQEISFTTGAIGMTYPNYLEQIWYGDISPRNDAYLRMNASGTSYVRFSLLSTGVAIYYTTSGPNNEQFLGGTPCQTNGTNTTWTFKAINNSYIAYQNGVQILSSVDTLNAVNTGSNYRGWGIGMEATTSPTGFFNFGVVQFIPNSITSVTAADISTYSSQLIWQLLNIGNVPHLRAESRYQQEVFVGYNYLDLLFIVIDWPVKKMMNVEVSQTDITIQESGSYAVHASVSWHPNYNDFDQSVIAVTVNGQDIGRKDLRFVRGSGFTPGFPQSHDFSFSYYFAAGDVVRVQISNNSPTNTFLWYDPTPPTVQTAWVELDFISPS